MKSGRRAVTIGASVGGLLAARALADHYDQVCVLERDPLPPVGEDRRGVPQGQHVHVLLAAGREAVEELFPGFTRELVGQGALSADIERVRWFDHGGYHARCNGIEALLVSRPRLEGHLRNRLLALPNVQVREHCRALSPLTRDAGGRVVIAGLRVGRGAAAEEALPADLVVDASGRGSKTPGWLFELGFPPPPEEVVKVSLGYSTRLYRRRSDHLSGDVAAVVVPTPPHTRGAVLTRIEGNRWMLTLMGLLGDHPPTDERGFLDFARSLPVPDVYGIARDAEPLTDPIPFRFPASSRRRYEQMERFPDGYLVFGDAICSFNPIYAQGMSVAALQAMVLRQCLARGSEGLAPRFFKDAARVVETPWSMAAGGDLRYPAVEGPRTPMMPFINWYLGKFHVAARRDPHLTLAFQKVANLLAEPPSLLQPRVALRVLRGNLARASSTFGPLAAGHRSTRGSHLT